MQRSNSQAIEAKNNDAGDNHSSTGKVDKRSQLLHNISPSDPQKKKKSVKKKKRTTNFWHGPCFGSFAGENESFSRNILESIADGAFTVNHNFEITSFNRAAENITGFSREDAIGMKCYNVFRANICKSNCALKKSIETGRDIFNQKVIVKDIDGDDVKIVVSTSVLRNDDHLVIGGVETFRDVSSTGSLRKKISKKYSFQNIISKNHKILKLFITLPKIAKSDSTVLIEGETGSGKELFARAIHTLSERKGSFVALNCAALPDTLLESELFGYKKGAFTGAAKDKLGRFSLAKNGTIFLDEIGDISPTLQLKLLRVLQEKEFEPLGGTATIRANARVIAATNKNLKEQVKNGLFRNDLYFRLNIIHIALPPFCERREDIPLLAQHFIDKFRKTKKRISNPSAQACSIFLCSMTFLVMSGSLRMLSSIVLSCVKIQ